MPRRAPSPMPEVPDGCPWTIVLGIDPGTLAVGYGALVLRQEGPRLLAAGVIRASRELDVPTRLGLIRTQVDELLRCLKPTVVVVEKAFSALNVQSALRIGEGRGVVLAAAACAGRAVDQYSPAEVKKALVGNGRADKRQVAAMVAADLGLAAAPRPLDASDALALALAHVHKRLRDGRLGASTIRRGERHA